MRTALRIPAVFLAWGFIVLSVAANFCFGLLLSDGQERWLYAFLFAFLDATKAFLLPWRDAFLDEGDRKRAAAASRAFWAFALLSFAAEFGLYKMVMAQSAAETATATSTYELTLAPKTTAEAKLKELPKTRERSKIVKDIDDAKVHPLWRRSKECKDVSLDDSEALCKSYNAAKAELGTLDEREKLQTTIADTDRELLVLAAKGTLATMGKAVDGRAKAFAELVQLPEPVISNFLGLLIAFLVELGSVLCPWFAFAKRQECPVPGIPAPVLAVPEAEEPEPAAENAVNPRQEQTLRAAQRWFDGCVVKRRGSFVTAGEIGESHEAWCDLHKEPALDKTSLGVFMRNRGFKSKKKGGGMRYDGIALAASGKPKLRIAADNTGRLGGMAQRQG